MANIELNTEQFRICRICNDTDQQDDMISPCLCRGTSKYVHRHCLDRWRAINKSGRAFDYCEVCQFQYVIDQAPYNRCAERCRNFIYYGCVFRDISLVLLIWQGILFGMTFGFRAADRNSLSIPQIFQTYNDSIGIYYGFSLLLFFAIVGIIGCIAACLCSCSNENNSGTRFCFCYIGTSNCGNCGDCGDCNGNGGDGAGAVILIFLIVLAAIGLLIGIFLSIIGINKLLKKYRERYWREQQTKVFIVRDFQHHPEQLQQLESQGRSQPVNNLTGTRPVNKF